VPLQQTFDGTVESVEGLAKTEFSKCAGLLKAKVYLAMYLKSVFDTPLSWSGNFEKRYFDICFAFNLLGQFSQMEQQNKQVPKDEGLNKLLKIGKHSGTIRGYLERVEQTLTPAR